MVAAAKEPSSAGNKYTTITAERGNYSQLGRNRKKESTRRRPITLPLKHVNEESQNTEQFVV